MTLNLTWTACAVGIVLATRICIGIVLHFRRRREFVQNLDEFTRRIEAMELSGAERVHENAPAAGHD